MLLEGFDAFSPPIAHKSLGLWRPHYSLLTRHPKPHLDKSKLRGPMLKTQLTTTTHCFGDSMPNAGLTATLAALSK